MPSISITKLFSFNHMKIFVSDIHQFADQGFAGVVLAPDKRHKPRCSKCGQPESRIHLTRNRSVRDLPLGAHRSTWIHYSYRLVNCSSCGSIHVESSDVADVGGPRVTYRFARYIQELCKLMPVKKVADHLGLNWKTVKNIDKQGLIAEFAETDYTGLRILAIDEISYARHHKYLTIVIDYETGRVVWTGIGRTRETLQQFFDAMPAEVRQSIEAVAVDMWEPYTQAIRENCPEAVIVYDYFHIVSKYSDVIDDVRRQEYHKASGKDSRVIKGSRWLLLKNPENLKETDKPKLKELLEANEPLAMVYILKDDLKAIWSHTDRLAMTSAFDAWCGRALEANLRPLNKFVHLLLKHREGILNHSQFPIHTSKLEGINNKIKVIKRESYGFHDQQYFSLKIKQRCAGKPKSIN